MTHRPDVSDPVPLRHVRPQAVIHGEFTLSTGADLASPRLEVTPDPTLGIVWLRCATLTADASLGIPLKQATALAEALLQAASPARPSHTGETP